MPGVIVTIVIIICIIVGVVTYRRISDLKDKGIIIKRESDFFRQKEIFSLKPFDFDTYIKTLKTLDWEHASSWKYSSESKLILFEYGKLWKAEFCIVDETDLSVTCEFKFTHWEEVNGSNQNIISMNATLTNVEKALVLTDPDTTVRSEYIKTKAH